MSRDDIRTVVTSKYAPEMGFVHTQLDATSPKHAVLRGNSGWTYLNEMELIELIANLQDLLEEIE